jgi:hypothetical protein
MVRTIYSSDIGLFGPSDLRHSGCRQVSPFANEVTVVAAIFRRRFRRKNTEGNLPTFQCSEPYSLTCQVALHDLQLAFIRSRLDCGNYSESSMSSKDQFGALEVMCRERAAIAKKEMEYWLAEPAEWKQLRESSDRLAERRVTATDITFRWRIILAAL